MQCRWLLRRWLRGALTWWGEGPGVRGLTDVPCLELGAAAFSWLTARWLPLGPDSFESSLTLRAVLRCHSPTARRLPTQGSHPDNETPDNETPA